MASMLVTLLLLGMLSAPAGGICVETPPLEFLQAAAAGDGGHTCDGWLQTNGGVSICGHISSAAAERACWELKLNQATCNGLQIKTHRCNSGNPRVDAAPGTAPYWVIAKGQIDWDCDTGSPDCFLDCHTGGPAALTGLLTAADCKDGFDTAIDCTDINECKEGVIHDCVSGFDHECMIGRACGNNTICTNTVGCYECACLDGFDGDPYDINCGCEDINECLILASPCTGLERCHNTIGSFVCDCPPGFEWNDGTDSCDEITCPALAAIPNAALSNGDTHTCNAGYESSYNEDYGIHIECRGDDYCHCRTASCVRKSCGVPPMDPHAETIKNDGLHTDMLTYTCYPGFEDDYTITCQDGVWTPPVSRCGDINECGYIGVCPIDSDCINTIGSFHCDCYPGYEGPTCKKISCGKIPEVDNAQRATNITEEDSEYKMTIDYDCEEGYRASNVNDPTNIQGSFSITCKLDKTWDHRPIPECVPIFCGDPGSVAHSSRYGDSFYYWEQVTCTCDSGFRPSLTIDSDNRQFRMRCQYDLEWDGRMTCINVNECDVLTKPCGVGDGHYCIDNVGSYTCSCAPKYRLDHTGTNCVPISPVNNAPSEPCELYNALGFCHQGKCYVDDRNTPRCRCDDGYGGAFCDEDDRINLTIPFILALLALSVIGFCIIVLIILSCYVCAKHHHDSGLNCPADCPPAQTQPPVHQHRHITNLPASPPRKPAYEVKYIAKQVPVSGATQSVMYYQQQQPQLMNGTYQQQQPQPMQIQL